jgi:cysteinyl-tRNA synthetase
MLAVIGLGELAPLQAEGDIGSIDPDAATLLQRRNQARRARDFETADRIRDELRSLGWEIRDGPDGAELIPGPPR